MGVDQDTIRELMGHKTLVMTLRYAISCRRIITRPRQLDSGGSFGGSTSNAVGVIEG